MSALLAASLAAVPGTALAESVNVEATPAEGVSESTKADVSQITDEPDAAEGDSRADALVTEETRVEAGEQVTSEVVQAEAESSVHAVMADQQPGAMSDAGQDALDKSRGCTAASAATPAPAEAKSDIPASAATPAPAEAKNGIPAVTVFIDESEQAIADARANDPDHEYGTFEELHASERHTVRSIGGVAITVPEGYAGEYGSVAVPEGVTELKYIRGRGNSTWDLYKDQKAPYKLEFNDKLDLFGMGASEEWALVANAMDTTLLKNRIGLWLADQVGLPYTPQQVPVDVYVVRAKDGEELSREYMGSYSLSEVVDIEKSRLAIDKLKKNVTAIAAGGDPNITGGYLLSMYRENQNGDDPKSTVFTVDSGATFINKAPEFESEDLTDGQARQRAYIRDYVRVLDQLIVGSKTIDEQAHKAIADRMDLEMAAMYWWIQELGANDDAFDTASTYLYKARDGKLCWGPIWDMDISWPYYMSDRVVGFENTFMPWFDALREKDPRFVELLKERWADPVTGFNAKLIEITRPGGILDAYRDGMAASWADNEKREAAGGGYTGGVSFESEVEELRQWIEARRAWIDGHLDRLNQTQVTADFVADGKLIESRSLRGHTMLDKLPEAPEREGYVFKRWTPQGEDCDADHSFVTEDSVYEAQYVPEDEIEYPQQLFLSKIEDWADVRKNEYWCSMAGMHDQDFLGKVKWTSSDERIAKNGHDGWFDLVGTGDVTITATLKNGTTSSMVLHVYDGETDAKALPTGITMPSEMTLEVGEMGRVDFALTLGGAPLADVFICFNTEDWDVVETDVDGVMMGLQPGTAVVKCMAFEPGERDNAFLEATCTVTVVEAQQAPGMLGGVKRGGSDQDIAAKDTAKDAGGTVAGKRAEKQGATRQAVTKRDVVAMQGNIRQAAVQHDSGAGTPVVSDVPAANDSIKTSALDMRAAGMGRALPRTGDVVQPQGLLALLSAGCAFLVAGLASRMRHRRQGE